MVDIREGDCRELLPLIEAGSIDTLVTDPPAGIGFMGKEWDSFPSGNRGICRKTGNGQPCDSHGFAKDVHWEYSGKARDTFISFLSTIAAECLRILKPGAYGLVWAIPRTSHWTATALENAGFEIREKVYHLFGTGFPKSKSCLKPAAEEWILVRKPAKRMTELNVDACRIDAEPWTRSNGAAGAGFKTGKFMGEAGYGEPTQTEGIRQNTSGRWPANVTHDGSDEVLEAFAEFGERKGNDGIHGTFKGSRHGGQFAGGGTTGLREYAFEGYGDTGTAARFFYAAKASRRDRGAGNSHPTVKNTALMRWLVRLIAKPGETVLDPFLGSGSTAVACIAEGVNCIGMEREPEYVAIARRRVAEAEQAQGLFAKIG